MGVRLKKQQIIWQITKSMPKISNTDYSFWSDENFINSINEVKNLKISLVVLKKHVPKRYHSMIRLMRRGQIWQISVESGVVANRVKMLLDEISIRIAKEIGYAPRLKLTVYPTDWKKSGVLLQDKTKPSFKEILSEDESKEIINKFIQSN